MTSTPTPPTSTRDVVPFSSSGVPPPRQTAWTSHGAGQSAAASARWSPPISESIPDRA